MLDLSSEERQCCIGKSAVNSTFVIADEQRNPFEFSVDVLGFITSSDSNNSPGYIKVP